MLQSLTARKEWKFFAVLPKADPALAAAWWAVLLLRGILPAAFAIAMGVLVGAVQHGDRLAGPLAFAGAVFVLLQVLSPIHQAVSANLGDRTAAWLYDRLTEACVRPPGMGHLEDPTLTNDLTVARDFDLGMTGPPLAISMDFIASGLVEMIGGFASAVVLAAIRVVGAAPARRRVAGDALAAARERASGATATPTKCARRSAMPITPTGWPSTRRPARSCGSSAWPAGPSTVSSPGALACTSCNTPPPGCASGPWSGACCWCVCREHHRVLVAGERRRHRPHHASAKPWSTCRAPSAYR